MRFKIFILTVCMLMTGSVFGQDLNQLTTRVSKLWEARSRNNTVEAMKFIDPETLNTFLRLPENPFSAYKISGIEFTDDPARVDVLLTVRGYIANVGELDRTVREPWVWKDGQWLMQSKLPPSLFESDVENRAPASVEPEFEVAETIIDIGRHTQGETVEGKIPFKAVREDIRVIRPLTRVPGLAIGGPVWSDATSGYLPYRWETTLLSRDVSQKTQIEALATSDGKTAVEVEFRARIAGKVGFKQVPEVIDPANGGEVELQIQNLTAKPLKILTALSRNSAYVIDENVPPSIDPGKTGSLLIRYAAQTQPTGAALGLVLSEELSPSGITTVPLNVKLPEEKRFSYTVETLKQFVPPPPAKLNKR